LATFTLLQDRSDDEKSGTQAFFGNFRTFETLAILKVAKPEGDLNPQQLLEWVLAEQKNNVGAHAAAAVTLSEQLGVTMRQ
jgi:hypothetical protein